MHSLSSHLKGLFLLFTASILLFTSCGEEDDPTQPPIQAVDKLQPKLDTSSFIDSRDSNRYQIVTIGLQTWMAENLKYLPEVHSADSGSFTDAFFYVYGYDGNSVSEAKASESYPTYGVLYNWTAAMNDSTAGQSGVFQGICPDGWHLPSDEEWTELTNTLGGRPIAGGKLKAKGTEFWLSPNTEATNESGFTALPGGIRASNGSFEFQGLNAFFWSSTSNGSLNAWFRNLYYAYGDVYRTDFFKNSGLCVRCLKDGSGQE